MSRPTSTNAYHLIQSCSYLPHMRKLCWNIVYVHGPMTSNEVYTHLAKQFPTYSQSALSPWKRLRELQQMGILQDLGDIKDPLTNELATQWDVIQNQLPTKIPQQITRTTIFRQLQQLLDILIQKKESSIFSQLCKNFEPKFSDLLTNLRPFVKVKKLKPHLAEAVILNSVQQECYDALKKHGPQTSNDLFSLILQGNPQRDKVTLSPWKVCSQLRDMGVIREIGERSNNVTNMTNIIWEAITNISTLVYVKPYTAGEVTKLVYDFLVDLVYELQHTSQLNTQDILDKIEKILPYLKDK